MSRVSTKHAQRKFDIARDDNGIPTIAAPSWLDALYGLGYMHAVDRKTQVLFARAVASGRGAEQIRDKDELLETDFFFRRTGLHLDLADAVAEFDEETLNEITVYCDGVNDGLKAKGRSLPMRATGFRAEPWTPASVVLVGRLLSFGGLAVSQLQNERLLIELIHAGADPAALTEMFEPRLDEVDFDLVRQVTMSNQMSDDALELLVDLPRLAGSNAWAVRPERSATGHALLAADPHLEINRLPAIWYEVNMRWPQNYLIGATLPGCPLFSVARTPRLAWGVTYMKGDTIDFFIEECRPGGQSGWQYRREDQWHDFELRRETIERKSDDPIVMDIYENDVGTLDFDLNSVDLKGAETGFFLSIAWVGRQVSAAKAISTWLELTKAPDVTAGKETVASCTQPTLCFVMADRDGHIGLQGCGSFPKRRLDHSGLAPLPAWDPANHWQGWLSRDLLPSIYDPPEGFLATANEEANPPDGPLLVTQTVHDYRLRRIRERLSELPAATVKDMQRLQYDVVSVQARELLDVFLPHIPDGPLKQKLTTWDYSYAADENGCTLFLNLYRNVMMELLGHKRGMGWRRIVYLCSRAGFSSMVMTAADRLLHRDESWWWHGRDKGAIIRRAAEKVSDFDPPPWSEVNYFHFDNRFFGSKHVGRLLGYRSKRKPMPGNHATIFQGHVYHTARHESTFAPSYHFVTDLGTDEAWTNLPGGPSESRFSKYYRTDVDRWIKGEYKLLRGK
jgi:penicillin amidase